MNIIRTLCLACLAAPALTLGAQPGGSLDLWYLTTISGKPVGYLHQSSARLDDGSWSTLVESQITLNRLGSRVVLRSTAKYREVGGKLRSVQAEISSSRQVTKFNADVEPSGVLLTTTAGGRDYRKTIPTSGELLGPVGSARLLTDRLKGPGDSATYRTFDGQVGLVEERSARFKGTTSSDLLGHATEVRVIGQKIDIVPGDSDGQLLPDGTLFESTGDTPMGKLVSVRCSAKRALEASSGGTLPEESFSKTLLVANVRLPHERDLDEVRLELTNMRPDLGWPAIDFANQKVISETRDRMVMEITRPALCRSKNPGKRPDLSPFTSPNPLFQSDDPEVERISHRIVGPSDGPIDAVEKLQDWTHGHMSLDLGVAVAPASEVVRDRHGTCVAYSMLLGSLARSVGIPTRMMIGYAYVEGRWGGHAWIEMWDGARWVPFDSALYRRGPSDAARIAFVASPLDDGLPTGPLGQMLGNIKIRTLQYTYRGHRTAVPSGAKPYVVTSKAYSNPWLGLTVRRLPGFSFSRLEEGWPESTVLRMDRPGASIEFHLMERGSGDALSCLRHLGVSGAWTKSQRGWTVVLGPYGAGAALADDDQVWAVKVTGRNARSVLRRALAGTHVKSLVWGGKPLRSSSESSTL